MIYVLPTPIDSKIETNKNIVDMVFRNIFG